jgi:hypothetical protein
MVHPGKNGDQLMKNKLLLPNNNHSGKKLMLIKHQQNSQHNKNFLVYSNKLWNHQSGG